MFGHEDECEKVNYEGGSCTCDLIRQYERDQDDAANEAAGSAWEDYDGPELDG